MMRDNRLRQAIALFAALAMERSPVCADDRLAAAGSTPPRSFSARPVQMTTPVRTLPSEAAQAPVRTAQIDSHGRYPFGQFRGGYRYPYSYPYYRYGGPRHYPDSFGVGPYGPYGSNYGGYSGNAYDPRVYGSPPLAPPPLTGPPLASPPPAGPQIPDAPPAPPAADPAPPARAPQDHPVATPEAPESSVPVRPIPSEGQAYGDPFPYYGASPYNPAFGSAQAFGVYPPAFFNNNMWFGQNRLIQGFGYYPLQVYNYPYGTPAGLGSYRPQYAPRYDSLNVRNFGPAYPTPGGINRGPGYYQGW